MEFGGFLLYFALVAEKEQSTCQVCEFVLMF